jgi:hypothetical protein
MGLRDREKGKAMTRTKRTAVALLVGLLAAVFTVLLLANGASATEPDPNHKVTICHRTHSASNPYVVITVDEAAVDGVGNHDDHQSHNEGPVPDPASYENFASIKAAGGWWGDVIPPFYVNGDPGTWPSLNYEGNEEFFEGGCVPSGESPSPTPSVTPSESPSPTPSDTPTSSTPGTTVSGTTHTKGPRNNPSPTALTGRNATVPAIKLGLLGLLGLGLTMAARVASRKVG